MYTAFVWSPAWNVLSIVDTSGQQDPEEFVAYLAHMNPDHIYFYGGIEAL